MPIKKALFNIKGMTRDLAASKFNPEYAYENRNLRLLATDDNTTGVLVNEKGPAKATLYWGGSPIGDDYFVIGQVPLVSSLIVFATNGGVDKIYEISLTDLSNNAYARTLFSGNLGFSTDTPIEGLVVYENNQTTKVYFTDGDNYNQPRVINVNKLRTSPVNGGSSKYMNFDFIRPVSTQPTVTITKDSASSGNFASGTIQYLFSYYSLYGQQTNIFYVSPIYYLAYPDRGASESDTVNCSFTINLANLDSTYDYIRIYSIQRTSIDGTPYTRKVIDLQVTPSNSAQYTDYGDAGESIDPSSLFYIGGEVITAKTMCQKDNTLFLGGITNKKIQLTDAIINAARGISIDVSDGEKQINIGEPSGYYSYINQLEQNAKDITTYKYGETYRFGLQFQDKYGIWSDPVFIGDYTIDHAPVSEGSGRVLVSKPIADISSVASLAALQGYVRVRPMVVFPSITERNVICQGVVNPTVYNVTNRKNHFPDIQASWFFRPYRPTEQTGGGSVAFNINAAEYRHNYPIPDNRQPNAEIQCITNPPYPVLYNNGGDNLDTFCEHNGECFYVNQAVFTFNSPDIEFDTTTQSLTLSNYKFRTVGIIPINSRVVDIDIQPETKPLNFSKGNGEVYADIAQGFYHWSDNSSYTFNNASGYFGIRALPYWLDELYGTSADNTQKQNVGFIVYPWQRKGSLDNARNVPDSDTKPAVLSKKKTSILRFSEASLFSSFARWTPQNGVTGITIFNSDEDVAIKLENTDYIYKGNIDDVIAFHSEKNYSNERRNVSSYASDYYCDWDADDVNGGAAYPIIAVKHSNAMTSSENGATASEETSWFRSSIANIYNHWANGGNTSRLKYVGTATGGSNPVSKYYVTSNVPSHSTDAVSMKYKSTPHAVVVLNGNNILPQPTSESFPVSGAPLWWNLNPSYTVLSGIHSYTGFLWLGEIYNDNVVNKFGGTSADAIASNKWIVAGEAQLLDGSSTTLAWTEGDTYYQRYDCLKTYPFTLEDENSVVDILSFMVETRINIDGRYDKNRGQSSNLYMTPNNFNLINKAYSQTDNFFIYRSKNLNKVNSTSYPTTVTWTKTKTPGEEIDTWTNITLASSLDLDGDRGHLTALRKFNDNILAFQDTGISQILYNENVQIASTTGVPIEIANSGKVTGKKYISNTIGCTNKWSICETPNGLYFVDNLSKGIYQFNGQLHNISDPRGFHSWVNNELYSTYSWCWDDGVYNCILGYDKINKEVLIFTSAECLAFSELTNQFTSFYDYGECYFFATTKCNDGDQPAVNTFWRFTENGSELYYANRGEYNNFFGTYKPFYTTIVVNPDPTEDKIFNNLEFRSDSFNTDGTCNKDFTFTKLTTWNEYQKGETILSNTPDYPSTLKKKFRVWRANIPRWNVAMNGQQPNGRDRMRNPWLYLKLSMENYTTTETTGEGEQQQTTTVNHNVLQEHKKTVLHDLVVDYFE